MADAHGTRKNSAESAGLAGGEEFVKARTLARAQAGLSRKRASKFFGGAELFGAKAHKQEYYWCCDGRTG